MVKVKKRMKTYIYKLLYLDGTYMLYATQQ